MGVAASCEGADEFDPYGRVGEEQGVVVEGGVEGAEGGEGARRAAPVHGSDQEGVVAVLVVAAAGIAWHSGEAA